MALSLGLLAAGTACRPTKQVPEPGALLLRLTVAPGAPTPDELRFWVYDDSGVLWNDVRVPEAGALAPESAGRLGTVLIQPGASVGALRLHVRGLTAGTRVLDGVVTITPDARARGTADLELDPNLPLDGDDDGVPDPIDDCPAIADPLQSGCPDGGPSDLDAAVDAGDDAGDAGDAGVSRDAADGGASSDAADAGASSDAGGDGVGCDGAGGCAKVQGAACAMDADCASGFCADGVCCANACVGPCRSCNQPNSDGVCLGYRSGQDPERECASGQTCNGAGACGAAPPPASKANGDLCGGAVECASGFCKDGVCCNTACTGTCQSCGSGTCQSVKRAPDVPECASPMTCNATGKCVAS